LLGSSVTDVDADAQLGIAITATSASGTWQYMLAGSSTWAKLPTVSDTTALLLAADNGTKVRLIPAHDFAGNAKLSFHAWDRSQGTPGTIMDITGKTGTPGCFSISPKSSLQSVTPVNDPPVVTFSGTLAYVHDHPAFTLVPYATVTDVDSPDFNGGRLRVRVGVGASGANRLAIGAGFTLDANNNVLQGSTIIGKRTSDGGGTRDLIVTFNSAATPSVVQQLVRSITFKTVGGAAGQRSVIFTVSDGDGGVSADQTKIVNVT
jgi:hypothetical protein